MAIGLSFYGVAQKKNNEQKETETKENPAYEMQKKIALQALKYNDANVAKNALYQMMAIKPERSDLLDSLALLYFQMGSYTQCIQVSNDLLSKDPQKLTVLEMKAISEQSLGIPKAALEDYEKLYPQTNDIMHLYQIARLQYDLKRFGECGQSIQRLLADDKLKESKIQIFLGQGQGQEIAMEAGIYNMQGMILLNLNNEEDARAKFKQALEIAPEFVLPKNNLAVLDKAAEEKGK